MNGQRTTISDSIYYYRENCNSDYSILESAFKSLGKILKPGDLAVLETTVPPGNTDGRIKGWLEEESGLQVGQFYLAHSPERSWPGCL